MKRMSGGTLLAEAAARPSPPEREATIQSHHAPIPPSSRASSPATWLGVMGALRALAIGDYDDGRPPSLGRALGGRALGGRALGILDLGPLERMGLEQGKTDRRPAVDEDAPDGAAELAGNPAPAPIAAYGEHAAPIGTRGSAPDHGRPGEMRELRHDMTPSERIGSA